MLRNENGRVTCTTELSVDLDEKMENNESHDMDQRSSSRRLCSRSRSCSGNKASSASIGSKASDDNVQRTRPPERRSSKRVRERALGRQSKRKFGVEKKKALKEGALS